LLTTLIHYFLRVQSQSFLPYAILESSAFADQTSTTFPRVMSVGSTFLSVALPFLMRTNSDSAATFASRSGTWAFKSFEKKSHSTLAVLEEATLARFVVSITIWICSEANCAVDRIYWTQRAVLPATDELHSPTLILENSKRHTIINKRFKIMNIQAQRFMTILHLTIRENRRNDKSHFLWMKSHRSVRFPVPIVVIVCIQIMIAEVASISHLSAEDINYLRGLWSSEM
jgi:hypothetical protein